MDRKNAKNVKILPIFLGGPMGPIHPVWASAGIAAIYIPIATCCKQLEGTCSDTDKAMVADVFGLSGHSQFATCQSFAA